MSVPTTAPLSMWIEHDAISLIRGLQPKLRPFAYHLALGSGVLNLGRSEKDLDLYLLPVYSEGPRNQNAALQVFRDAGIRLVPRLSQEPVTPSDGPTETGPRYYTLYVGTVAEAPHMPTKYFPAKKIDLFVVKG
jgi:hypothetical protein